MANPDVHVLSDAEREAVESWRRATGRDDLVWDDRARGVLAHPESLRVRIAGSPTGHVGPILDRLDVIQHSLEQILELIRRRLGEV